MGCVGYTITCSLTMARSALIHLEFAKTKDKCVSKEGMICMHEFSVYLIKSANTCVFVGDCRYVHLHSFNTTPQHQLGVKLGRAINFE